MKYTDNALNIYTAKSYNGIGNAWIVKNLKSNESVDTIVTLLNKTIKGVKITIEEFEKRKRTYENKLIEKLENFCDGFVALGDKNFPQHRGNVKDSEKPVFLFYKGNIDLLSIENINISVIGLLNPKNDIKEREREIVAQFVKNGATIVSGLAFGCDSIAHRQALDSNGKTVAILPSPLDNILPSRNQGLAFQIVEEGGLLITEYGRDFYNKMELNNRYKERDRLQALFCDTIVLAASYAKNSAERWEQLVGQKLDSGARHAMKYAEDYNIPRAVMYDQKLDETNPMFDLNRDLMKNQGVIEILTMDNYTEIVKKIVNKIQTVKTTSKVQTVDFNIVELHKNYETTNREQVMTVREPTDNDELKEKIRKLLNDDRLRAKSTKELLEKVTITWTSQKLANYLKKLDFVEVVKVRGKNLYKLKGTKNASQSTLF